MKWWCHDGVCTWLVGVRRRWPECSQGRRRRARQALWTSWRSAVDLHPRPQWRQGLTALLCVPMCLLVPDAASQYGVSSRAILEARSLSRRQGDAVCAVSCDACQLSRISYELFTKCVLTHSVCTERYRRHKSWHFGNKFLNISKSSPRHGTHYFTRPASPRTLSRVLPSSARQIACHGVNSLSCMPVWRLSYCLLVYGKAVAATSRWRRHWGHVCTVSANRSASLGQNCYNKSITPMGRHDKPCRHQWGTARGLL